MAEDPNINQNNNNEEPDTEESIREFAENELGTTLEGEIVPEITGRQFSSGLEAMNKKERARKRKEKAEKDKIAKEERTMRRREEKEIREKEEYTIETAEEQTEEPRDISIEKKAGALGGVTLTGLDQEKIRKIAEIQRKKGEELKKQFHAFRPPVAGSVISKFFTKIRKADPASKRYMRQKEKEIEARQEIITSATRRVELGGRLPFKELNIAGQVYEHFSERRESLENVQKEKISQQRVRMEKEIEQMPKSQHIQEMEKEISTIKENIPTEQRQLKEETIRRKYDTYIEEREKQIGEVREKYRPEIERIQERHQPEIKRIGQAMERAQPVGMQFIRPFERVPEMDGVAGEAKDITVQTLEKELIQARHKMFAREEVGGRPELRRADVGPMMAQILKTTERQRGVGLGEARTEVTEQLIKKTEDFIKTNKDSGDQIDKFIKKFGEVDTAVKGTTDAQGRFANSLKDMGSSMIAVTRMSSGLVSSLGSLSRGDLAGVFSGITTFMLGLGRVTRGTGRIGARLGGLFGAGGVGKAIGGGIGFLGGLAGAGLGAVTGIGALGINAAQKQFQEAAQYEQAAYRIGLMQGQVNLPSREGVRAMAGRALGGGLTVPQYQQVSIQAAGRALLTPQQTRAMVDTPTAMGPTPIAEMARFAAAFGRPVEELGAQVGAVARATGANFQNVMETMTRMGDVRGMQGSLFTGEMQNAFAQISETLMRSLGGIRGIVREGAVENIIAPMVSAGVTPRQAAGVAGSLQQYVTGAIFQPQQRLLLESLGVSRQAIERGRGPGDLTGAEEVMRGLGVSGQDLRQAADTGVVPQGFGRVKGITGIQDTERAFTVMTRYIMGFSAGLSNSIIETAKNVKNAAKLRQELNELTKGTDEYTKKQNELNKVTTDAAAGQKKYNDIQAGGEFLLSFKEKMLEATGGIARAMEGLIDRGAIAKIMKDIEIAFQPILGLAANAIKPVMEIIRDALVQLGGSAEELRAKLKGIDTQEITKQLTSGELFKEFGTGLRNTITSGIANILVDAGQETVRLIKNQFAREHPRVAKAFGIEPELTEGEEFKKKYGEMTLEDIEEGEKKLSKRVISTSRRIQDIEKLKPLTRGALRRKDKFEASIATSQIEEYLEKQPIEGLRHAGRQIMGKEKQPLDTLRELNELLSKQLEREYESLDRIVEKSVLYDEQIKRLKDKNKKEEDIKLNEEQKTETAAKKASQTIQKSTKQELKNKLSLFDESQKSASLWDSYMGQPGTSPKIGTENIMEDFFNAFNLSGKTVTPDRGSAQGSSKEVTPVKPQANINMQFNFNGKEVGTKNMVAKDGGSYSVGYSVS